MTFDLSRHFPRASQAFLDANQQNLAIPGSTIPENPVQGNVERIKGKRGGPSISPSGEPYWSEGKRGRHGMNKTEAEYAMILEAMKRAGEILRYEFEGITLRFANVKYTPDFVVLYDKIYATNAQTQIFIPSIKFIEVKGPFCKGKFERAVERFRHAKTYYGDVFSFELHQKTKNGWQQII